MQFNNPNILYALFALLIPIIVHLFQLRKFHKTDFTNVKFLKELAVQTRKSAQLKKWLLLVTRLIIITCIVFAFSKPFIPNNRLHNHEVETIFYIDNSFSNSEKGEKGELLKVAVQDIIENYPNDKNINIITNTKTFKNKTLNSIKSDLIELEYTPFQLDYKSLGLKAEQLFNISNTPNKQLICVSDFQKTTALDSAYFNSNYQTYLIQSLPVSKNNISIDSVYFSNQNSSATLLNIIIKNQYSNLESVPISIYNNDSLINKSAIQLKDKLNTIAISIPDFSNLNLKVQLTDQNSLFDNTFFASKPKPIKQHVLAIGTTENNIFLSKIFTNDEFDFKQSTVKNIDFSSLENQHLIVLNELENLSTALIKNLKLFSNNGGTILCIPTDKINPVDYNTLNNVFGLRAEHEVRLTKIHFSHPIYSNVFEKQVSNFQYPTFKKQYRLKNYENTLLTLENGIPLLVKNGNYYTFSSALNSGNTNFKQAPLIVPTLYNIAKSSLKPVIPYYIIGKENKIDFQISLAKDDVLNLQKEQQTFTPLQYINSSKVTLMTTDTPNESGLYTVFNKIKPTPYTIAFNYDKSESIMAYHDIETLENNHLKTGASVINTINQLNSIDQVATLWKWFVIFAILFLLVELLILKYFK